MSESEIQKDIIKFLRANGFFVWKHTNAGKMPSGRYVTTMKGISDIISLKDGMMVCIEVKEPKGKASKKQKEFLSNINTHCGIGFVARSVNDVRKVLKDNILL